MLLFLYLISRARPNIRVPPSKRPGSLSPPTFRQQEHQLSIEAGSDNEDETEDTHDSLSVSHSLARPLAPLALRHDGSVSATSVESLAFAAAIAHANGMVLKPDPNSHRGKSPATEEYPSPPPSNHGSPHNSRPLLEDEEQSLFHTVGSFGSTGHSSLPTTPALIDSFPTIPNASLYIGNRDSQVLPSPLAVLSSEALPIRTSSRPGSSRQRAGTSLDAWSRPTPPVAQRHNSDLERVWDLAEQDETEDYNHPLHPRGGLPLPGPPPSVPLPPEPSSPRFQTSAIHKHFHQLELDFTSLTRKLTSASSNSGNSTHASTSESSKILKKSASHSLLRREHSGMSASSGASSSHGMTGSVSISTAAYTLSSSPQRSDGMVSPYSTRHNSIQASQPIPPNRQRSTTESSVIAPLKLKEKAHKSIRDRDSSKCRDEKEREKDGHQRRRFFSKYASAGSQVEREAAALLASIADRDDVSSFAGGQNEGGNRGFPDDEWGVNLGASSGKAKEGTMSATPLSPSSQRSPVDDASSIFSSSWTGNRTGVSPTEYVVQHILPPAELLRLESVGWATGDAMNSRGRDGKLASPLSAFGNPFSGVPPSSSPLKTGGERNMRSMTTSRADEASPVAHSEQKKTRSQRSGSLATPSPISPSVARPSSSRHNLHGNSGATKSSNALPLGAESRPSSSGNGAILHPPMRPGMIRPATTPSSPAGGFAPLSLPPPPRSRVKSLRSYNGEGQTHSDSTRSSRRSSNASSSLTASTVPQKHQSIMKKPSFIDMMDDDGRPSLEEASPGAAPGLALEDSVSYFPQHGSRTPSTRSRSTTINGWQPETPGINTNTSSTWGPSYATNRTDDSFLDMGKLSLDTIRSEDEINPQVSQYRQTPPVDFGSSYGPSYF